VTDIAFKMLLHAKARLVSTVVGIAFAFFLSASQVGLLVGWCNTCSAIIRHADADVWVMAEQTPAFDYGTPIPGQRIYQVRSVPGVAWAEGLIMSWMFWQLPDGRQQNVEMVGLDERLIGAPWQMQRGDVHVVYEPDSFIVDALYRERLGIGTLEQEVEVQGQRAVVRGLSENVRTLTAAPFVFTSLDTARRYDPRYRAEEVTYVVAKCEPGHSPMELRDRIAATVSSGDVLTSAEFATRTIQYWMLETGLGNYDRPDGISTTLLTMS
jgi:putative ABC transport system permease protein